MTGLRGFVQRWIVFVVVVVVWQLLTAAAESPFFPTPVEIVEAGIEQWFGGDEAVLGLSANVYEHVLPSIARWLGGWLLAAVVGVAAGIALGRSRYAMEYFQPVFGFLRAIPPVMLLPFFLLVFGIGATEQLALIIFSALWPILLNSVDGARSVDSVKVDTVRSFRIPRAQWIGSVVLPAAMPKIFAGLRVSLSLGLVLMVISELVGATNGIGYELVDFQRSYDYAEMWAYIVLLGVLGYGLNSALLVVERRVLSWQPNRNAERRTVKAGG